MARDIVVARMNYWAELFKGFFSLRHDTPAENSLIVRCSISSVVLLECLQICLLSFWEVFLLLCFFRTGRKCIKWSAYNDILRFPHVFMTCHMASSGVLLLGIALFQSKVMNVKRVQVTSSRHDHVYYVFKITAVCKCGFELIVEHYRIKSCFVEPFRCEPSFPIRRPQILPTMDQDEIYSSEGIVLSLVEICWNRESYQKVFFVFIKCVFQANFLNTTKNCEGYVVSNAYWGILQKYFLADICSAKFRHNVLLGLRSSRKSWSFSGVRSKRDILGNIRKSSPYWMGIGLHSDFLMWHCLHVVM